MRTWTATPISRWTTRSGSPPATSTGETGDRPVINLVSDLGFGAFVVHTGTTLSDVEVEAPNSSGVISMTGGVVERIIARTNRDGSVPCEVDVDSVGVLRDSFCFSGGEDSSAIGAEIFNNARDPHGSTPQRHRGGHEARLRWALLRGARRRHHHQRRREEHHRPRRQAGCPGRGSEHVRSTPAEHRGERLDHVGPLQLRQLEREIGQRGWHGRGHARGHGNQPDGRRRLRGGRLSPGRRLRLHDDRPRRR